MVPAGKTDDTAITDSLVHYGIATPADLTVRATARIDLAELREEAADGWTIPAAGLTGRWRPGTSHRQGAR